MTSNIPMHVHDYPVSHVVGGWWGLSMSTTILFLMLWEVGEDYPCPRLFCFSCCGRLVRIINVHDYSVSHIVGGWWELSMSTTILFLILWEVGEDYQCPRLFCFSCCGRLVRIINVHDYSVSHVVGGWWRLSMSTTILFLMLWEVGEDYQCPRLFCFSCCGRLVKIINVHDYSVSHVVGGWWGLSMSTTILFLMLWEVGEDYQCPRLFCFSCCGRLVRIINVHDYSVSHVVGGWWGLSMSTTILFLILLEVGEDYHPVNNFVDDAIKLTHVCIWPVLGSAGGVLAPEKLAKSSRRCSWFNPVPKQLLFGWWNSPIQLLVSAWRWL